ncbi:MAG TPA: HEAT repeat domain-containing protein [Pirellulaceae bacterium]|nr:HEAT repeat domain-containing protein [Pirellulaceae bacterium]
MNSQPQPSTFAWSSRSGVCNAFFVCLLWIGISVHITVLVAPTWPTASAAEPPARLEDAFAKWVKSPPMKTRGEYRRRLQELGLDGPDAVSLFALKVGDEDVRARRAAVHGLSLIGSKDLRSALPAVLQAAKDSNQEVRAGAAGALGSIGSPAERAIPALMAVLESDESYVAARAIAEFGPNAEPAIGSLTKALDYKHNLTRSSAAEALGKIGAAAKAAAPGLRTALNDDEALVRVEAAYALWRIEGSASPAVIEVLIDLLATDDLMTKLKAIVALAEIGPPAKAALPALERVRKSDDKWSASRSILATGKILGEKDLVAQLLRELSNKDPAARSGAAWALGTMGPEAREALPALRKLLDPPDTEMGYGLWFVQAAIEQIEKTEPK